MWKWVRGVNNEAPIAEVAGPGRRRVPGPTPVPPEETWTESYIVLVLAPGDTMGPTFATCSETFL